MTVLADETSVPCNCFRCGYDLRETADDQPCPECGLLAVRSRRVSDELHHSRPRWLRGLARGVGRIVIALLLAVTWPFAQTWIFEQLGLQLLVGSRFAMAADSLTRFLITVLPLLGLDVAALFLIIGVFSLTAAEGYSPADALDRTRRVTLRALVFVPVLALALMHVMLSMRMVWWRWWNALEFMVLTLLTVGCAPFVLLLFLQLRSLAKRARSAHLAEHCAIVGIGTGLALVFTALVILLAAYQQELGLGSQWVDRSPYWLLLIAVLCALAGLFVLWSLYLLIRFAISFGRAGRTLRQQWQRDDRALGPA